VILQAIGSSGLFAAGGVAGVAGGGANMCDKHSAEHVGHEKAEKAEKAGLRGVALSIASSIVGAYQPVGGFRFVYTVGAGATVGDGARHYIRIAQSEQETLRCVCVRERERECVCVWRSTREKIGVIESWPMTTCSGAGCCLSDMKRVRNRLSFTHASTRPQALGVGSEPSLVYESPHPRPQVCPSCPNNPSPQFQSLSLNLSWSF
jgi:hypothetical protein